MNPILRDALLVATVLSILHVIWPGVAIPRNRVVAEAEVAAVGSDVTT